MKLIRSRHSIHALNVALALLAAQIAGLALAQTYTERPYDPPVGSKWQIVAETTTTENRPGQANRDQRILTRADLSIDEKLPDGFFRVTYTNRGIDVNGPPSVKIVAEAYSAMKDIPVRARLDKAGRPVEVENLAEVKAKMKGIVDQIVTKFDSNPKIAAVIRELLQSLFVAEGRDAATAYLEELPQLATVQNTGLKSGDVRRDTENNPNPFGGPPFKVALTTRLDSYDDKAGKARFIRKREFEKESLREAVMEITRRLAAAGDNKTITPEMMDMMKKVNFGIEGETVYDVDNGMTIRIDDREFTSASVMGTTFSKQQKKTVAVTRQN
jgi:hypothetical protein